MPYVEILAPPAPPQSKAALAKSITDGLMSSFGVGAETITLFFVPIAPDDYAHAGEMGSQGTGQRILAGRFVMVRVADNVTCAQVRAMSFP